MKNFNKYICRKCKENDCELSFDNKNHKKITKTIATRKIIKGEPFVKHFMNKQIRACDCIIYLEVNNNNELIILVELKDDKISESEIKNEIKEKFSNTIDAILKYNSQYGSLIKELLLLAKSYDTKSASPQFFKIAGNKGISLKKGNKTYYIKCKKCGYNIYETIKLLL